MKADLEVKNLNVEEMAFERTNIKSKCVITDLLFQLLVHEQCFLSHIKEFKVIEFLFNGVRLDTAVLHLLIENRGPQVSNINS